MQPFHVWIRPLGEACRVRVDGLENGRWLLSRLMNLAGDENCEPIQQEGPFEVYSFMVSHCPAMTRSMLGELLAAIPEVDLIRQPA